MDAERPNLRVISSDDPSDDELLAAISTGDPEASRELIRRYQADVHRFLNRLMGVGDAAVDDLAQLTFVSALDGAGRFDGRAAVRTWLLGIAHNKARMEIRSRMRRRRAMDLLGALRLVQPQSRRPDADDSEIARRIQDAVKTLDADRRTVFVLTEVEEMTCREAAEVVGAPEGTVRRWRAEARQRLRPLLADLREHGGVP